MPARAQKLVNRHRCTKSVRVKSLSVEAAAVPVKVQKLVVAAAAGAKSVRGKSLSVKPAAVARKSPEAC